MSPLLRHLLNSFPGGVTPPIGESCRLGRVSPLFIDKCVATRLETAEADLTGQYVEAYSRLYPVVGAVSKDISGARVSFAGVHSPLSRVDAVGLRGPVPMEDLDEAHLFLESRLAPPTIETCAFTDQSVFDFARRRGYGVGDILNVSVLALQAGDLPGYESAAHDASIKVERLSKNPEDSSLWSTTVGRGFASTESEEVPYMDIYRGIFHATGTTGYLATLDGKPAGAGALKIAGRVAYLSTASTLPSFRNRGVQMALMKARLAEAVRLGCDLAAVVTSPGSMSERNVHRAGFATAYARIRLVGSG